MAKILAVTLVLGLIAFPVPHFAITSFYLMPKIESDHQRDLTFFPRVLSDLKVINQHPPFPQNTLSKNAESFLSKHVSWEGKGFSPMTSINHKLLKELFSKYPKWQTDSKQFKALYTDPNLMQIEVSWADYLENYSHWDFSSHQSIQNELKKVPNSSGVARIGIFSTLPIPNYSEFRKWATVYALKNIRKRNFIQGLSVFRKMAQLSHSSGNLIGNMIAAAMLEDEHTLLKNLNIESWELIPKKRIDAYKRVSWAWLGIIRTTWFHSFPKDFEPYLKPETGACAAVWENSGGLSSFQDFLEDRIIFEKNFSDNLSYSRKFQKHLFSLCNMKNYEGFVGRTPAGANPLIGGGYNSYFMGNSKTINSAITLNWSRVPYIRQIIGLNLITLSIPNYFRHYEQTQKQ